MPHPPHEGRDAHWVPTVGSYEHEKSVYDERARVLLRTLYIYFTNLKTYKFGVAQWKRGGPITLRSLDRNQAPKTPRIKPFDFQTSFLCSL